MQACVERAEAYGKYCFFLQKSLVFHARFGVQKHVGILNIGFVFFFGVSWARFSRSGGLGVDFQVQGPLGLDFHVLGPSWARSQSNPNVIPKPP